MSAVGAFFDLDGTLLEEPSLERRFVAYLLRRGKLTLTHAARWMAGLAYGLASGRGTLGMHRGYLAGLPSSLAREWATDVRDQLPWNSHGIARIAWHAAQPHSVYIVSGTLAPLVRAISPPWPCSVEICATELETRVSAGQECWTGRLQGEWMAGAAKGRAIRHLAEGYDIDLARSYAYGNSAADALMLAAVGRPFAVNPAFGLRRIAARREWSIVSWRTQQRPVTNICIEVRE